MSSYVEGHVKKIQVKNSCLSLVSCPPTYLFRKFTAEQVLELFLGRNNFLKPLVFGFCDSPPFGLEESRELRALIRWILGNRHSKMQKISAQIFFCVFELSLWIYELL